MSFSSTEQNTYTLEVAKSNRPQYKGRPCQNPIQDEGAENINALVGQICHTGMTLLGYLLQVSPNRLLTLKFESLVAAAEPGDHKTRMWVHPEPLPHKFQATPHLNPRTFVNTAQAEGWVIAGTFDESLDQDRAAVPEEEQVATESALKPTLFPIFGQLVPHLRAVGAPRLLLWTEVWRNQAKTRYGRVSAVFNPSGLTPGLNNPWEVFLHDVSEVIRYDELLPEEEILLLPNDTAWALAVLTRIEHMIADYNALERKPPTASLHGEIDKLIRDTLVANHPFIRTSVPILKKTILMGMEEAQEVFTTRFEEMLMHILRSS